MSELPLCPQCGAELPPDAPQRLCPKCLVAAGFESAGPSQLEATAASPGSSGFVPPSVDELAERFPQLEILELLGKGGMGAVYKARQPGLDRLVAIKILPPEVGQDPAFAERFTREARAMARLSHPNIVTIHDFGQVGPVCWAGPNDDAARQGSAAQDSARQAGPTLYYFVMEYVDGANLRETMQAGKLKAEQALAIVPQVCDALQYAHDEGVVHRDVKPENILLDKRGRVKIADFGLSKLMGSESADVSLTGTHQVMGTIRYMAPEQMEGTKRVDHRADIYSLGVVFYELLTGDVPMGRFDPPSQKVEIDVRLDEVVLRALAQEPDKRYQHASDVKTDVESVTHVSDTVRHGAIAPGGEHPLMAGLRFFTTPQPNYARAVGVPILILMATYILITLLVTITVPAEIEWPLTWTLVGGTILVPVIGLVLHLRWVATGKGTGQSPTVPTPKAKQRSTTAVPGGFLPHQLASVVGLTIIGGLGMILGLIGSYAFIVIRAKSQIDGPPAFGVPSIGNMLAFPCMLAAGLFVVFAAERLRKLRSYDLCVAGSIVAVVLGVLMFGAKQHIGFFFAILPGIYTFWFLQKQAVRNAFADAEAGATRDRKETDSREPSNSWHTPGTALIISGLLIGTAWLAVVVGFGAIEDSGPEGSKLFATWFPLVQVHIVVSLILGALTMRAGMELRRLESPRLARVMAIAGLVPLSVAWIVSFPVGLWTLAVLRRPETQSALDEAKRKRDQERSKEADRESPMYALGWLLGRIWRHAPSSATLAIVVCALGAVSVFPPWLTLEISHSVPGSYGTFRRHATGLTVWPGIAASVTFASLGLLLLATSGLQPARRWRAVAILIGGAAALTFVVLYQPTLEAAALDWRIGGENMENGSAVRDVNHSILVRDRGRWIVFVLACAVLVLGSIHLRAVLAETSSEAAPSTRPVQWRRLLRRRWVSCGAGIAVISFALWHPVIKSDQYDSRVERYGPARWTVAHDPGDLYPKSQDFNHIDWHFTGHGEGPHNEFYTGSNMTFDHLKLTITPKGEWPTPVSRFDVDYATLEAGFGKSLTEPPPTDRPLSADLIREWLIAAGVDPAAPTLADDVEGLHAMILKGNGAGPFTSLGTDPESFTWHHGSRTTSDVKLKPWVEPLADWLYVLIWLALCGLWVGIVRVWTAPPRRDSATASSG